MDQARSAGEGLKATMESLREEREAELLMMERGRGESVLKEQEAWKVKVKAMEELWEGEKDELKTAHDGDVKIMMDRMEKKEALLDSIRADNVKMRRSLDEAISRLRASQEDVIDCVLMKNVLLDWHSKRGEERVAVMGVMASMLGFDDDEKERASVHNKGADEDSQGVVSRVVGAVAAPLPKSAIDVNELQGETVGEKWKSFLLAEIGD